MDRKTMNTVMKLRAMGATYVRLGSAVEVRFTEVAQAPAEEQPIRTALEQALNEFHDAVDDQREVDDIETKKNKRQAVAKLKYTHAS